MWDRYSAPVCSSPMGKAGVFSILYSRHITLHSSIAKSEIPKVEEEGFQYTSQYRFSRKVASDVYGPPFLDGRVAKKYQFTDRLQYESQRTDVRCPLHISPLGQPNSIHLIEG